MIIVKLMGGLGNQMFQYAAAKRLALANHTTLKLDTSFLRDRTVRENFTFRKYALEPFVLNANIATRKEIDKYSRRPLFSARFDKIVYCLNPHYYYSEKQFNFNPDVLELCKNTYLDGYFQSEKYFIDYQDQIRNDFTFSDIPNEASLKLIDEIAKTNSVAVHIRRGDYVSNSLTNQYHGICSLNYYLEGIKYLKSKLIDPFFFFFSDDMTWVKQNFSSSLVIHYVEVNDNSNGCNDLRLMSLCRHNVIANSSFSWWGAWLNCNPEKIIIAPRKWFTDDKIQSEDIIPEKWIRI
jgi:hypothetical protein